MGAATPEAARRLPGLQTARLGQAEGRWLMNVILSEPAKQDFDRLPSTIQPRVEKLIERLKSWPSVSGTKALKGAWQGHYRVRTGDYRLIFAVGRTEILVVRIGHRDKFYEVNMPRGIAFGRRVKVYDAVKYAKWAIGRNVRRFRRASGLTQAELAGHLHLEPRFIKKLEEGSAPINVRLMDRIFRALGA